MAYRVLHIDDDPLMRDVVELSLALDPSLHVISCDTGDEALARAATWEPDLILCDVMMPDMDGPAVLQRLRASEDTADIPLVFMTARAQPEEAARLTALGAVAVIAKPFEPEHLADTVRRHLPFGKPAASGTNGTASTHAAASRNAAHGARLSAASYDFTERLRSDAETLAALRAAIDDSGEVPVLPNGLLSCVHKLAGAAGVFNFIAVSQAASDLEETIIARCAGRGAPRAIDNKLDALLDCIARERLKGGRLS